LQVVSLIMLGSGLRWWVSSFL